MSIYKANGYENRLDYLQGLAEDNGVPLDVVISISDLFGPNEDFDGLVSAVRDYADGQSTFM